jgi:hypothetical protein
VEQGAGGAAEASAETEITTSLSTKDTKITKNMARFFCNLMPDGRVVMVNEPIDDFVPFVFFVDKGFPL